LYVNGKPNGYRKDKEGNTVITKLDDAMLQQIASVGKGIYVRATNSQDGLSTIFERINGMQKAEFGNKVYTDYEDRFQYFIAAALFF
jgi:Ca-activated chloride channel family protein